ncbi:WD repeat-containing protein 35 [Phymastichus coffea]|uniref:WD repeat-containing protein 35 n=1 Tax=Phymastichus coffea TaxID=108790 RepID=UPI00273B43F0|nr:WD repeat-containing protein 35 [Phymastichus coffea]
MFAYLSKKIAIPNNIRLNCLAWNEKQGYISVGGEDGLLKVIRAEPNVTTTEAATGSGKNRSMTSTSNLNMNQTLEGHNGHVQVVTWNEEHQKLTSSDQNGVIIVWMLYKGSWYEEMINNRNKSVVKGMSWSSNGQKICIVYEDGAVIVGSVEGNRIWGKELKSVSLTAVQWSPDSKLLLFGCKSGEAHLYDDQGVFLKKLDNIGSSHSQAVVAISWYNGRNGYTAINCPILAVCFQSGKIVLLRDTMDENPITIDATMSINCCSWNSFGSTFAIAGISISEERKDSNVVSFYSPFGELLRVLKVPGKELSCCSWEGGSLRICLSVDSNIYFANIRPHYKWAYFGNTVIFTDEKVSRDGVCVTFWNTTTNARYSKYVRYVIAIGACGEHCVIAAQNDSDQADERYVLYVCNAISTPVDTKFLDFEPHQVAMNNSIVVVASKSNFLLWTFRSPRSSGLNVARSRRDRFYHVDDTPSGVTETMQDLDQRDKIADRPVARKESSDPIRSLSITDKLLLVGRDSGMIQQYSLPQVTLTKRHSTGRRPCQIFINCDSTMAAIIDAHSVMRLQELGSAGAATKSSDASFVVAGSRSRDEDVNRFERKDAWAVCWAQDNPRLVAVVEKSRIYIFRGLEPEEPISCSGYVCCFRDLEIRCVLLDELVQKLQEARSELVVELQVKSLRDTRELLKSVGLREAEEFVRDNPHPRLWRLLAEHALRQLELDAAESAMVRCADYLGIRFIKRLRGVREPGLQRAEVLAFLGDHEAAEQAYLDLERRELAVELSQRLANYPRALQLMRLGSGDASAATSDAQLETARLRLGGQLAARQQWAAAREHLALATSGADLERLLECHYRLEEYEELAALATRLRDGSPELLRAARMLASVGMCQPAVQCLVRCSEVRQAVEVCVRSNRWDQALELARNWRLPGIAELLGKYARHLLASGRRLQAVELYRKAERPLEAAELLLELAEEQASQGAPPLRLKKLFVLAALLAQEAAEAGQRLGSSDHSNLLERAWRGAEAYHLLLLAHRQLYAQNYEAAMRTALRLREYEPLLEPRPLYALLALASCGSKVLVTCSRALVRLEAVDPRYEELALEIFARYPVRDSQPPPRQECTYCESLVPEHCIVCPNCSTPFTACIVTGRPLMNPTTAWLCTVCKHYAASERDVLNVNGCPLCHSIITYM